MAFVWYFVVLLSLFFSVVQSCTLFITDESFIGEAGFSTKSEFVQLLSSVSPCPLQFAGPYDTTPLFIHGQWLYEHLIIAVPEAEEIGANVDELVAFVRNGKTLLLIADDRIVKEPYRQLANAFGLEIDYPTTIVKDQAKTFKQRDDGTFTTINVNSTSKIAQAENIIYRGIGHHIRKDKNKPYFVSKIVQGNPTTVTMRAGAVESEDEEKNPIAFGNSVLMASTVQTPNNGRFTFIGSAFMVSDEAINAEGSDGKKSGNKQFVQEVVKWALAEKGVLQARDIQHRKINSTEWQPLAYRVGDEVEFSIIIEEWSEKQWRPFVASDVYLEFTMMDPYVRIVMQTDNEGRYFANFRVPETYGVYKFVIDYQRAHTSHLYVKKQVSVRPYRHNEFERFIPAAYPYYISIGSVMCAFFLFSIVFFLRTEDPTISKKTD